MFHVKHRRSRLIREQVRRFPDDQLVHETLRSLHMRCYRTVEPRARRAAWGDHQCRSYLVLSDEAVEHLRTRLADGSLPVRQIRRVTPAGEDSATCHT